MLITTLSDGTTGMIAGQAAYTDLVHMAQRLRGDNWTQLSGLQLKQELYAKSQGQKVFAYSEELVEVAKVLRQYANTEYPGWGYK